MAAPVSAKRRPWQAGPFAHHQFKEPHEDCRHGQGEHPELSAAQEVPELVEVIGTVRHEFDVVGDGGPPQELPQHAKKEPSHCSKIAWLTTTGTPIWGNGGMPLNFFSGFFGIKLQKVSRFFPSL